MGSNSKSRWKLSFRRSSSTASLSPAASASPTPSFTADLPLEFLCPISGSMMAEPVIIPSGQTFERSCIQACLDLAFAPPDLHIALSPPPMLIPNCALKSAIVAWCARFSFSSPLPLPPEAAVALVRCLMPTNQQPLPSAAASAALSDGGKEEEDADFGGDAGKGGVLIVSEIVSQGMGEKDGILPTVAEEEPKELMRIATSVPGVVREREKNQSSSFSSGSTPPSSSNHSSSSFSSSEIVVLDGTLDREQTPRVANSPSAGAKTDALEETLVKFTELDVAEQESAAANFRKATRESHDRRVALCTLRLLGALRPMLISPCAAIQIDAAAAIVNLSLGPMNKVPILRSGIVPALVELLRRGPVEARYHAAGALFSLALEEENRTPLGVIGAIPPLLDLFTCLSTARSRARHDAGMALHHLSLTPANRSRIVRTPGAVHALLAVASERATEAAVPDEQAEGLAPARIAMMMIHNLAGCREGIAALMDAGGVSALADLLRREPLEGADKEHCMAALYFMSQRGLRFRGLAKAAGAEQALARLAAEVGGGTLQEMARRTLRAMRGKEGGDAPPLRFGALDGEVTSPVSDRLGDFGNTNYRTDRVNSASSNPVGNRVDWAQ
ncbi:U-box domain-containing protein 39-like [Curcuma longa]|uniref:U-box domain-containing protein 39-like n=1 Tax=Curcuma longa TaxID=136217 RepID=UPI003D9F061D